MSRKKMLTIPGLKAKVYERLKNLGYKESSAELCRQLLKEDPGLFNCDEKGNSKKPDADPVESASSSVRRWINSTDKNGNNKIPEEALPVIAKVLQCRVEYLTGEDERRRNEIINKLENIQNSWKQAEEEALPGRRRDAALNEILSFYGLGQLWEGADDFYLKQGENTFSMTTETYQEEFQRDLRLMLEFLLKKYATTPGEPKRANLRMMVTDVSFEVDESPVFKIENYR